MIYAPSRTGAPIPAIARVRFCRVVYNMELLLIVVYLHALNTCSNLRCFYFLPVVEHII